ncbi:hypothetical protein SDJN03_28803, partial [Cucurbita argyrosperma subsp. sororia]
MEIGVPVVVVIVIFVVSERESAEGIFRERNRRRPRDFRRRIAFLKLAVNFGLKCFSLLRRIKVFCLSSAGVGGGRSGTLQRGHCRASGRLGVITFFEVLRAIGRVYDWEFGTQL